MYKDSQGQLNTAVRLERTTRKTDVTEDDFVQFYPSSQMRSKMPGATATTS